MSGPYQHVFNNYHALGTLLHVLANVVLEVIVKTHSA